MYYIYIPFQGKRIYWNRILQRWVAHIGNASPYTEAEADKVVYDYKGLFGIAVDKFKDK